MAAKIFEVGDVLPATTQLRISWVIDLLEIISSGFSIKTASGGWEIVRTWSGDIQVIPYYGDYIRIFDDDIYAFVDPYTNYDGIHPYIDIDTSLWPLENRTVSFVTNGLIAFEWEDLNAIPSGYSITFEENGGTSVTDLTEQTTLPTPLPTTTKANHVFAGWYYDNLFTQKATAGDELTANVTLYAKWYTPTTWCEDIADAIREKEGSSEPIKHVDFPDRIRAL